MLRDYLKKILWVAIPISIQSLMNMTVNLIDTMMIGRLGETAIASVGLANKVFFIFILLIFGISSGNGTLASQYYGSGDIKKTRKVLGLGLSLALSAGMVFMIAIFFFPQWFMRIFTHSEKTIELGAIYLVAICISYPFTAVKEIYVSTMRAVGRVKTPVVITLMAILINIFFNYVLIFGNFGVPALGVAGAAYATVIARVFECLAIIGISYLSKSPIACPIADLWGFDKEFLKKFIVIASPVIANEFLWGLGTSLYSAAYGRMGDDVIAAMTITYSVQDIFFSCFSGAAMAALIILGNELGAGKLETAKKYGSYSYRLSFISGIIISVLLYFLADGFIALYHVDTHLTQMIKSCLMIYAIFIPFKMLDVMLLVGILRSGGDTRASFLLDSTGVWCIGIPMAFIGGLVLRLPIHIVYAMVLSEEVYKMVLGTIRYKQGIWIKNLT